MHEALAFGALAAGAGAYAARVAWVRRFRPRRLLSFGELDGADGESYAMADFDGIDTLVVVFMSNRCPGVKAYDARLRALHARWRGQAAFLGINPVPEALYPDEGLAGMAKAARRRRIAFPYLKDADQDAMRAFGAVCTPEVFVLDRKRRVRYRGRIDDAIVEAEATQHFLADAIAALAAGQARRAPKPTAPLGCTIDAAPTSPS